MRILQYILVAINVILVSLLLQDIIINEMSEAPHFLGRRVLNFFALILFTSTLLWAISSAQGNTVLSFIVSYLQPLVTLVTSRSEVARIFSRDGNIHTRHVHGFFNLATLSWQFLFTIKTYDFIGGTEDLNVWVYAFTIDANTLASQIIPVDMGTPTGTKFPFGLRQRQQLYLRLNTEGSLLLNHAYGLGVLDPSKCQFILNRSHTTPRVRKFEYVD